MSERVRFTIAVDPEVHEAFADLAYASGVSLSRCIGDWLRDTAEAAQITTIKVNAVRKAPEEIVRAFVNMQADEALRFQDSGNAWGLVAEMVRRGHGQAVASEASRLSRGGGTGGAADRGAEPAEPVPPSSLTGGKSPGKTLKTPTKGGKVSDLRRGAKS